MPTQPAFRARPPRPIVVSLARAGAFAAGAGLLLASSAPVLAQAPGGAPPPPGAATPAPGAGAARAERASTVLEIVRRIARGANATVLADSSVAGLTAPLPKDPTTPENFEAQLDDLVKALGKSATWAKLYLPAPARGGYDADAVTDFAMAQARLFGTVGAAAPAGTVEILGKRVGPDQAPAFVAGLDLKPVYLVTNPGARGAANWNAMTDEQKEQFARQQATQLVNADNAARQAFLMQNMSILKEMVGQMTPEQRQQLFQNANVMFKTMTVGGPAPTK